MWWAAWGELSCSAPCSPISLWVDYTDFCGLKLSAVPLKGKQMLVFCVSCFYFRGNKHPASSEAVCREVTQLSSNSSGVMQDKCPGVGLGILSGGRDLLLCCRNA